MNSKVIKVVAGGGKTTESIDILKNRDNGLYIAYTNSAVNDIKYKGYICKTIDSLFQSYLIPKCMLLMPLIAQGARIQKCISNQKEFFSKIAGNISMDTFGNFYNGKKLIDINIKESNNILHSKSNFDNSKVMKYIFDKRIFRITDKLRDDISMYLVFNYGNIIIELLKERFDYIIIDEAQDLKGYREEFAQLIYNSDIELFLLGDDNQNIMGGGNWFKSLSCTQHKNRSWRCSDGVCKWIRDNLEIEIYGNEDNNYSYFNKDIDDVIMLDDGKRVLLYDSNRGKIKGIINSWSSSNKRTIKDAKGHTIKEDVVILGNSLNKNNLYTAITRTTKNVYSTIEKINE